MHAYEIRILRADHTTDTIVASRYINDDAALRAARKLAEARPMEVWRGLNCIYGASRVDAPSALRSPPPSLEP